VKRLTGLDASFLYLESPQAHMHVGSVIVLDPATAPGGWDFARMQAMVENRLQLMAPFRRRLVEVPFGLHRPLWIEDPDFDLDYHLRRAGLPSPGGQEQLLQFAAEFMGRPLDRSRPLWEMYVVDGLEDGLVAVVSKVHHAAIDGVSGAELTVNLLDLSPETRVLPAEDPPWQPDRRPSDVEMVAYSVNSLARQPLDAVKAVRRTTAMALNLRARNRQPEVTAPPPPFAAPRTSLNGAITPHRRFAVAHVDLDEVKRIKNILGGTVNDVVMALCAGALRRHFDARGEVVEQDLVAMVPISVRTDGEAGTMGNRVSAMLVSLATTVDDPVERLQRIQDGTARAKDQEHAVSASTLTNWTEFAAPAVAALAARLLSSTRTIDRLRPIFNVVISNVPGPNIPLYSAGCQVRAIYPMGPINLGLGLNMTVMSYMGGVHFGLVACRETVPEVDALAGFVLDSLTELTKAADKASGRAQPAAAQTTVRRQARGPHSGARRPPRRPAPDLGSTPPADPA
jgi:WS/DGAT/MGAT family acyltransferase